MSVPSSICQFTLPLSFSLYKVIVSLQVYFRGQAVPFRMQVIDLVNCDLDLVTLDFVCCGLHVSKTHFSVYENYIFNILRWQTKIFLEKNNWFL